MKTLFFCLSFLAGSLCIAQNDGELIKKDLQPFTRLSMGGETTVFLKQTQQPYISFKSADAKSIEYSIKGDQLTINGSADAIYLGVTSLTEIDVAGTAELYSSDTLKGDNLSINASGAGDINLLLNCALTKCQVTGTSDVKLAGNTSDLNALVSGSGDLLAQKLYANTTTANVSGSADAKVNCKDQLKGAVSGSGTLYYAGNPAQVDVAVTGSGALKKLNKLDDSDTTRVYLGNREIIILDKNLEIIDSENEIGDDILKDFEKGIEKGKKSTARKSKLKIWSGFELGINGWLNSDNSFNMDSLNSNYSLNYGKSIVVNFNFWEARAKLIRNNVTLVTGLGTEINNYRFDKNIKMSNVDDNLVLTNEPEINYLKSKYTVAYINAPLYFTFASNPIKKNKRLFLATGVTGGWQFASYNKRKIEVNGDQSKSRLHNDFNTQPFRANASVRLGYGNFLVFANYSLNEFFRKNMGPSLIPFSVGCRITGF